MKEGLSPLTKARTFTGYEDLRLPPALWRWMRATGHQKPSPLQAQIFHHFLADQTCVGLSPPGTGEQLAPLLASTLHLLASSHCPGPRALHLFPTRELALQHMRLVKPISGTAGFLAVPCFGGISKQEMCRTFSQEIDMCVATPKCFRDVCVSGTTSPRGITFVVLLACDQLLAMGLGPLVKDIVSSAAPTRQGLVLTTTDAGPVAQFTEQLFGAPPLIVTTASPPG